MGNIQTINKEIYIMPGNDKCHKETKQGQRTGSDKGLSCIYLVVRGGLIEEVTFEKRPE